MGIVWRAAIRSIAAIGKGRFRLERFALLAAIDGVQLYSLQVGLKTSELRTFSAAGRVKDLAQRIGSFHTHGRHSAKS